MKQSVDERSLEIELWLDLLCWESILKILLIHKLAVRNIYYCQVSKVFIPFQRIFQKITGIYLISIDDFVSGEERIHNNSAYEIVHTKLKEILETWSDKWMKGASVREFASKNKFSSTKIREHLKEAGFYYFYRPIELSIIAKMRPKKNFCFILRKTPFSDILSKEFEPDSIYFYTTYFSHRFAIHNRDDYLYDKMIQSSYYSDRLHVYFSVLMRWALLVVSIFLVICSRCFCGKSQSSTTGHIGVELLQRRVRLDEINDIFWLNQSQIDPKSVYSLELRKFDPISEEILKQAGINRTVPIELPWRLFNLFRSNDTHGNSILYIVPDVRFILRTIGPIVLLFGNLFRWSENAWIRAQLTRYTYRAFYWRSIYEQLNIKILVSIVDSDRDKLTKAQALEMIDGCFVGSHFSNFPMIRVDNQKCYDILFTWGPHFVENIINDYPSRETFVVGYPLDYYFEKQKVSATAIRMRYPETFILSYQDNIMANDLPYSMDMQVSVYEMLLNILDENKHVTLFLKPKRKLTLDKVVEKIPKIDDLIKDGRIVTFLGETEHAKAVPAMIGMASDLVVGLGISTAAAECQFAGTLAFHADLTGFKNNEFGNRGLGRVVFRDITNLDKAIRQQIHKSTGRRNSDYRGLYENLEPFQDGHAYRRIGFVLLNLQELLSQGLPREVAIKSVRERYDHSILKETKLDCIDKIECLKGNESC